MKRNGRILVLTVLALLMGSLIALFAGASEKTGVLTVVYPNGTVETFAKGEAVTKPTVPSDFPFIKDGKAYKYTVTGADWEYSSPLPAEVSAADLGKTVTASVAGECGTQQVYYTSLEKTALNGTRLVYHLKNDLNKFFSSSNTGDRGDGTNTGASSYLELRKQASSTKVTMYADLSCTSFTINWKVDTNRFYGGPTYLDLNGYTITNTQTSYIDANGIELHIYSSKPDAHWYQMKSSSILRVNDDMILYIGDDGSGEYTDNLSVHAKSLFLDVYGKGAYVIGGRYYQTGASSLGGMIDIKRRMHKFENAKIFVLEGQSPLTDSTANDGVASEVEAGTVPIKNCTFYAPSESPILTSTKHATLRFEDCNFINIRMDTAAGTAAKLSYAAGNCTNLPPRANIGKSGESIYPVKLAEPRTLSLTDASGASFTATLDYQTKAVAGGLTVSYADGESMLRLIGETVAFRAFPDSYIENGKTYKKSSETHIARIDGVLLSSEIVTEEMAGKSAEAEASAEYIPALFTVTAGDRMQVYANEETYAADLAACLASLEDGAQVKLYADVTLPPVTVAAKRTTGGAPAAASLDLNGHRLTFEGSGVAMRVLMPGFSLFSSAPSASVVAETHTLFSTGEDNYKWIGGVAFGPEAAEYGAHPEIAPTVAKGFLSVCGEGESVSFVCARVNADMYGLGAQILGGVFSQSEISASPYFLLLSRQNENTAHIRRVENATFVLGDAKTAAILYRAAETVTFKNCRFISAAGQCAPLFAEGAAVLPTTPAFEGCDFFDILPERSFGERMISYAGCGFGFSSAAPEGDLDTGTGSAFLVEAEARSIEVLGASYRIDKTLRLSEYDSVKVLYPDGAVHTYEVGETIAHYAMADTKTEDRRLYKLVGKAWHYSLLGERIEFETIPPEAAGKCLVAEGYTYAKVYFTSKEEVSTGTVLVYHLENTLDRYFSEENLGDRGNGTNTGANSFEVLRLATTKRVTVTLYENLCFGFFTMDWDLEEDTLSGRPVNLDLNGFDLEIEQRQYVEVLGIDMRIYSSVPGANFIMTYANQMFRPNDSGTIRIGNNADGGAYAENITFHCKAICTDVWGSGVHILGGIFRQTAKTTAFLEVSRRIYTVKDATFYLYEGTEAVLGITAAINGDGVAKGVKTITNCRFYAPVAAFFLYDTTGKGVIKQENCEFHNVLTEVLGETLSVKLQDGSEHQLALGDDLSSLPVEQTYTDASGRLYLLMEKKFRVFDETGAEISLREVTLDMLGAQYTVVEEHVYKRVYYTVQVGDTVTYNTDAQNYSVDLEIYLSAMDHGATVTLYTDVLLSPVRVTAKQGADRATLTVSRYALDLNGHSISFAETRGVAFDVRVSDFCLYSSQAGGRILAEGIALVRTSTKVYEAAKGDVVSVTGTVTLGEASLSSALYGKNLSVSCHSAIAASDGGNIYILGATVVQSTNSATPHFFATDGLERLILSNASVVLQNKSTALFHTAGEQQITVEGCNFVCTAEGEAALFAASSSIFGTASGFDHCNFYNVVPALSLGGVKIYMEECSFGFSSAAPAGDLDGGIDEAHLVSAPAKSIMVQGRTYTLGYALALAAGEGCTVVYPDGTEQIVAVGQQILPLTNAESFVGKNGKFYKRSDAGWRFLLDGTALSDLTVTADMIGKTVTATGYDQVYFTVQTPEGLVYYTNASTAASSLKSYLGAMDMGAVVKLWSDFTLPSKLMILGKRHLDNAQKNGRFDLDLNGYTVTFSGSNGATAMIVQAAEFYLYSSRPGGTIRADGKTFFYSDNDDYKWINGVAAVTGSAEYKAATGISRIQISSTVYLGEDALQSEKYGANLTVYCASVNKDMYGTGAYFLGGTFVQSTTGSAPAYFLLLSRETSKGSHIKAVNNTTFVVTKAATAPIFYYANTQVAFTDSAFISTAGRISLCYSSSDYTKVPSFTGCSFYDVMPTVAIKGIAASYSSCFFGFSGSVPTADMDSDAERFAGFSAAEGETVSVLGVDYCLTHTMIQSSVGFVTVVYPHGHTEIVEVGAIITPFTGESAFLSDGILYADLGAGWIFSLDGRALSELTVTEDMAGKTVEASGYGRVYFSVEHSGGTVYYTNASTYATDLKNYLSSMEIGSVIVLYENVSLSSVSVAGKRGPDSKPLSDAKYYFDLNGHTITFTASSDYAFDVKAAGFHLYSSAPGGRILAESAGFFRSNDDDYKWINGAGYSKGTSQYGSSSLSNIQIRGYICIGEDKEGARRYGDNLTIVCKMVNSTLYGKGAYIAGGTFIQSDSSTSDYFFLLSRKDGNHSHITGVENATFVIKHKATAPLYYRAATAITFKNCRFISTAGEAGPLFALANTVSPTGPRFEGCGFYDVTPVTKHGGRSVVYSDCSFGFTKIPPTSEELLLAHSASITIAVIEGREYTLDCVLATSLSEVLTIVWGEGFTEYWMLGTMPQCNPAQLDIVVMGEGGTAVSKVGAIVGATGIRAVTPAMLGTVRYVEVNYRAIDPVAFSYTDANGNFYYKTFSPDMTETDLGLLFHETFDQCDGAYTILLHTDIRLTKGLGWGPLGAVSSSSQTLQYQSLSKGNVTLDLNGFTLTVDENCVGVNASDSNGSSYPQVGWGAFAFEIVTSSVFTLTSSRPGAKIDNRSASAFIVIGQQSSAGVVIDGENIEFSSKGVIVFAYEIASGASLTVNGGVYNYKGGAAPFVLLGTASISNAEIYMTGAPTSAFGAHYYNRLASITVKNTLVYSKNQTSLFAFYDARLSSVAVSGTNTRTLSFEDCLFLGVTMQNSITGVSDITHVGTALTDHAALLALYGGVAPENTSLAYLQRTVDGVTYRLGAYLTADKIGVVDWGYGLGTEKWRLGEYATRANATVSASFGYTFLPTLVDETLVFGNASLVAMRPGIMQMSLTLQGQIGINFYLAKSLGATAITVAGVRYDLSKLTAQNGYYRFTTPVAPDLADREVSVVLEALGYEHALTISIEKYAATVLSSDAYASAHDLTYAMIEHVRAQTGSALSTCAAPEGYRTIAPTAKESSNAKNLLLTGFAFSLNGTVSVAIRGEVGTRVTLLLSTGRSETVTIADTPAIFESVYINEFFGDMTITATKDGKRETYVYSLENYLYYQGANEALKAQICALYNYTYHAHVYVDKMSGSIRDKKGDHLCDLCGISRSLHIDMELDGICDECGEALPWSRDLLFEQNADGSYTLLAFTKTPIGEIVLPDTYLGAPVTAIADDAFRGALEITALTLPENLRTIGARAFRDCALLSTVRIGGSLQSVASQAFLGTSVDEIFYRERAAMWRSITVAEDNAELTRARLYLYSETTPTTDGYYWYETEAGIETYCFDFDHNHACDECNAIISACTDESGDHLCDRCGRSVSSCADADRDHLCDVCKTPLSECADANENHLCDLCDQRLSECKDADHNHFCEICGERVEDCIDESRDHICEICGQKASECADANHDHLCDVCAASISLCADTDKDHFCDECGEMLAAHADADRDHICEYCKERISACTEENGDHLCDLCGKVLGGCLDADGDHFCDLCAKLFSFCTDADFDHYCDLCDKKLPCEDTSGDHLCELCGQRVTECADEDKNHLCDLCGATLSTCADLDRNHLCDTCEKVLSEHFDADRDHLCDHCHERLSSCIDGNANHLCDECGVTLSLCRDNGLGHCALCGRLLATEGLRYRENAEGGYTVIGIGDCIDPYIYIPKYYNGKPVTAIGGAAFAANRKIVFVSIPDSVKSIGTAAFIACPNLCEVEIRGSATIGHGAFALCSRLRAAELGGAETVGLGAFFSCTALESVRFGTGLRLISLGAFSGCSALSSVCLPEGLETIGLGAFSGCETLESIYLPASTLAVGRGAFSGCDALSAVYYAASDADLGGIDFAERNHVLLSAPVYSFVTELTETQGRFWYYGENGETVAVTLCPVHSDENHNRICDFCSAAVPCAHTPDAYGSCLWCNHFVCTVHVDTDNDRLCDRCAETFVCEKHSDFSDDGICDRCGAPLDCSAHADGDADGFCDSCGSAIDSAVFPWQTDTITVTINNHSGGGILSSRGQSFMAGEIILADAVTEQRILERNAEAYEATRILPEYRYLPEFHDEYGWSMRYSAILTSQAKGVYSDVYYDFAYDMIGAALLGCFANLKGEQTENYFEFAADGYAQTVGDQNGYMYDYMTSLAFDESRMYLLASDYFIDVIRAFYCMPANASKLSALGDHDILGLGRENTLADLADAVATGAWTYELMMRYVAALSDEDGHGLLLAESEVVTAGLLYTSAVRLYGEGANGVYETPKENEALYAFAKALNNLTNAEGTYLADSIGEARGIFAAGDALFGSVTLLGDLEASAYHGLAGGVLILPVPVQAAGVAYETHVHDVGRIGAISEKTAKFSQCSAFLNYQSTHSDAVLASYFANDLRAGLEHGDAVLAEANAAMLSYMRESLGSAREQMLEISISIFCAGENAVCPEGEASYASLRWQNILVSEHYDSTYIRSYYRMLRAAKDRMLALIYENGATSLPD